jgi:nitroreductase
VELGEVVRRRRMVRNFDDRRVAPEVVDRMLDLARRAPSAGFSQGVEFLVLEGPQQTAQYWDVAFPDPEARARFRWQGLFRAPVLVLPMTSAAPYVERYAEPDKAATGLGTGPEAWPVPYWLVDAGMATQILLLAAVDEGLGALLFGIFRHEDEVLRAFGAPQGYRPVGVVAIGHPAPDEPGRSASRRRRPLTEVVHRGRW